MTENTIALTEKVSLISEKLINWKEFVSRISKSKDSFIAPVSAELDLSSSVPTINLNPSENYNGLSFSPFGISLRSSSLFFGDNFISFYSDLEKGFSEEISDVYSPNLERMITQFQIFINNLYRFNFITESSQHIPENISDVPMNFDSLHDILTFSLKEEEVLNETLEFFNSSINSSVIELVVLAGRTLFKVKNNSQEHSFFLEYASGNWTLFLDDTSSVSSETIKTSKENILNLLQYLLNTPKESLMRVSNAFFEINDRLERMKNCNNNSSIEETKNRIDIWHDFLSENSSLYIDSIEEPVTFCVSPSDPSTLLASCKHITLSIKSDFDKGHYHMIISDTSENKSTNVELEDIHSFKELENIISFFLSDLLI